MKKLITLALLPLLAWNAVAQAEPKAKYRDSISPSTFNDGDVLQFRSGFGGLIATFFHEPDGSIRLEDPWKVWRTTEVADWYPLGSLSREFGLILCRKIGAHTLLSINWRQVSEEEFLAVNENSFLYDTKSRVTAIRCGVRSATKTTVHESPDEQVSTTGAQ